MRRGRQAQQALHASHEVVQLLAQALQRGLAGDGVTLAHASGGAVADSPHASRAAVGAGAEALVLGDERQGDLDGAVRHGVDAVSSGHDEESPISLRTAAPAAASAPSTAAPTA